MFLIEDHKMIQTSIKRHEKTAFNALRLFLIVTMAATVGAAYAEAATESAKQAFEENAQTPTRPAEPEQTRTAPGIQKTSVSQATTSTDFLMGTAPLQKPEPVRATAVITPAANTVTTSTDIQAELLQP